MNLIIINLITFGSCFVRVDDFLERNQNEKYSFMNFTHVFMY